MAGLRKARAYSKKRVVPYTRISKKKSKSFIKTVPQQKIVKFSMELRRDNYRVVTIEIFIKN